MTYQSHFFPGCRTGQHDSRPLRYSYGDGPFRRGARLRDSFEQTTVGRLSHTENERSRRVPQAAHGPCVMNRPPRRVFSDECGIEDNPLLSGKREL